MNSINNPNHPVVLFVPEIGIYPYSRGLAVLGDAVIKQGGKVLITHDTGQMLRTPIMSMRRTSINITPKERSEINKANNKQFNNILKNYKFSAIELSDFVDDQLMKEINSLANKNTSDLREINFMGFPVGKIAEFDFILGTKYPYYPKLSRPHRELYLQYVKNTALAIAITDRICKRYKPSLFLTFNEYAQCQGVRYGSSINDVRFMALTYPVNFNIDASRFSLWKTTHRYWTTKHIQNWNKWRNISVEKKYIEASWKDSVFRMYGSGSHIFSSRKSNDPRQIFEKLKLDPKRKTIVVYTSSRDERITGEVSMKIWKEIIPTHEVFKNQIDWLRWLRSYADKRKDVQIVVRVHPREGIRHHGSHSLHLQQLKDQFKQDTSNFVFVWPDDPISSYDLMELADVCLISWSTIGQEAARVGVPVLSCVGNIYYPNDDFIQIATTKKKYKRMLDLILNIKLDWMSLVKAVRFYHWRTFIPSLDLSRNIPKDVGDDTIWPKINKSQARVINSILSGKRDLITYNIRRWIKFLSKNAYIQEKYAMKYGIRYFLDSIFYPPRPAKKMNILELAIRRVWREIFGKTLQIHHHQETFEDYNLRYTGDVSKLDSLIHETRKNKKMRVIIANGSEVTLVHNGKTLSRMSPMVARLARMYERESKLNN